jgi:YVTN family beta-propeller protein
MGYSPDHKTLAVVSIGSNSVTFIDTATNAVKHVTYVGRSPHEAFFTPDGRKSGHRARRELVSVIDAATLPRRGAIEVPPARHADLLARRQIRLLCSSFNPRRSWCQLPTTPLSRGEAGEPVLPKHRRHA